MKGDPMLNALKNEGNRTFTENGAATLRTTGSDCMDLFSTIGALTNAPAKDIVGRFIRAYAEDPLTAMRILFFSRDIRGGLGERKIFRTILRTLSHIHPESVKRNIQNIAEYGRYDDLLTLLDTPCQKEAVSFIKTQLDTDLEAAANGGNVSLLAKWLPSVNASSPKTVREANILARGLCMSNAEYRKTLSLLRSKINIIENDLRESDYSFDYSKQPSKAMFKYRRAFLRNDMDRYTEFLTKVQNGTASLHADTLLPYKLIARYMGRDLKGTYFCVPEEEKPSFEASWKSLSDYTNGENAIVVVDNSGSMYTWDRPMPATIALSLGLYFAERNTGLFHNHFITFSRTPRLIELKGDSFLDRFLYAFSIGEVADTNLEAVFSLILKAAIKNQIPQKELPAKIYVITDMEFNRCVVNGDLTNFEKAKAAFNNAGYELPNVVFWNVASRNKQQPVRWNEQGVALVSGCTPRLFSMATGNLEDPYKMMQEILGSKRYAQVCA